MNPLDWAKSNPKLAAGGAGGVAAAGLALAARRKKAAAAATPAAATSSTSSDGTAGLSGIPNTLATDIENAVQDQLNTFQNGVNQQIAGLTKPPTTPAPAPAPTPHPRPPITIPVPRQGRHPLVKPTKKPAARPAAAKSYTIPAGGTLWGAAQAIFGTATPANVAKLASQNNIKLYQRNGTTYADVYQNQVVRYQP